MILSDWIFIVNKIKHEVCHRYYTLVSLVTGVLITTLLHSAWIGALLIVFLFAILIILFRQSELFMRSFILLLIWIYIFANFLNFYRNIKEHHLMCGKVARVYSKWSIVSIKGFQVKMFSRKSETLPEGQNICLQNIRININLLKFGYIGTGEFVTSNDLSFTNPSQNLVRKVLRYLNIIVLGKVGLERLYFQYKRVMGTESASMLFGMLFGDRFLVGSVKKTFLRLGVIHIAAVSGYNVTIFISMVEYFLQKFRKKYQILGMFMVTFVFVALVGFSPPIARAGGGAILGLIAKLLGYYINKTDRFWFTFLALILYRPTWLYSLSFQLSMLATWLVLFLIPYVTKWTRTAAIAIQKNIRKYRWNSKVGVYSQKQDIFNIVFNFFREYIFATTVINVIITIYLYIVKIPVLTSLKLSILNNILILPLIDVFIPLAYFMVIVNIFLQYTFLFEATKYFIVVISPITGAIKSLASN